MKKIIKITTIGITGIILLAAYWLVGKKLNGKESDQDLAFSGTENCSAGKTETSEKTNPKSNLFVTCGGFLE
jgi:hypothetical protein